MRRIPFFLCFTCLYMAGFVSGSDRTIVWKLTIPVFLRGKASILCIIPENDKPGHMAWKRDGKLIGLNNVSNNLTKYDVFTKNNNTLMIHYLVIKNIGLEDLNIEYKCESGFSSAEGILPLNEETFVALPKKEDIYKNFTLTKGLINVFIEVTAVYPQPRCIAKFKDKDITKYSKTTYFKESMLFSMKFDLVYQADDCGHITASCVIGKNGINFLLMEQGFKDCEKSRTTRHTDHTQLSNVVGIPAVVLGLIVIVCVGAWYLRKKRKQKRKKEIAEAEMKELLHSSNITNANIENALEGERSKLKVDCGEDDIVEEDNACQ